jgi:hypothetical protein
VLHPPERVKGCLVENCPILSAFQRQQSVYLDDHQFFWKHDQTPLPVAYTLSPILVDGLLQGMVLTFNDATRRRHQEDDLLRALHDQNEKLAQAQRSLEEQKIALAPPKSDRLLQKIRDILQSTDLE